MKSRLKYRTLDGEIKIREFEDSLVQGMWIEDQEDAWSHNRPDAELDEVISQQHTGILASDWESQLPENKIPVYID